MCYNNKKSENLGMVDLLRWAWASPTLAGLHCTRVYISLFVCLDWPLTRQIFCKGWTFMASALHFSSRKWRASVVLKDIGSEDNSNWNTHCNLVLITELCHAWQTIKAGCSVTDSWNYAQRFMEVTSGQESHMNDTRTQQRFSSWFEFEAMACC